MLSVRNLRKVYKSKKAEEVVALDGVSIDFPETGFVFLLGKSGSGKSTLLNAIGGLDKFDDGEIIIKGKSSKDFSQADFDSYRNTFIGFIFQEYNILENFSVAKNLALALELQGKKADNEEVMRLLNQVEMGSYAKRKPNELSGGQKQRVAIARALIKNPEIIMADEPTGALDSNTGKQVMDTLKELSKTKLVIVVSHDREFAELYGDRIIELKDGKILQDVTKKEIVAEETNAGIKIIDDDIVYIKKGQELSAEELKNIASIITRKSKENDAFISFNGKANEKLKEGAKINDDGNKEKFLNTEKEDVNLKQYDPNSLKLIKSKLKFSDSLKMGASSLKNKVGKLIFTILLSFFAFTCFGIIDALSQWNRASSVYDAMQITGQKNIIMVKEKFIDYGSYSSTNTKMASDEDLEYLAEKFPNHMFLGSVGGDSWGNRREFEISTNVNEQNSFDSFSTNNALKKCALGSFVSVNNDQLSKLGFSLFKGQLPTQTGEVAISKFMFNNLVTATENKTTPVTEENILNRYIKMWSNGGELKFKIVGIIDDKSDFSKYANKTDEELQKIWTLDQTLGFSPVSLGYICSEDFNTMKENASGDYIYWGHTARTNSSSSMNQEEIFTLEELYEVQKNNYQNGNNEFYYNESKQTFVRKDSENSPYGYLYTKDCYYEFTIYSGNLDGSSVRKYDKKTYEVYNSQECNVADFLAEYPELSAGGIPTGYVSTNKEYTPELFLIESFVGLSGNISDYIASDGKIKDLADNVSINFYDDYWDCFDDMLAAVQEGTFKQNIFEDGYGYNTDPSLSLKVLGTASRIDNVNGTIIVSKNVKKIIEGYFGTYNTIISALTETDADKELVKVCETFGDNNTRYTIQNDATSLLNTLESFVDDAAKYFMYVAIAFAVFAALMLMNFISTSINHKKREIGVLRALGARGSDIFGIFFNEATIIALINFVLSAVATLVGCAIINAAIIGKLGYSIALLNAGIRQVILILAVSWGSALLASLLPTTKISRKRPIDAINNR